MPNRDEIEIKRILVVARRALARAEENGRRLDAVLTRLVNLTDKATEARTLLLRVAEERGDDG